MNEIESLSVNQYLFNHIEICCKCNENGWVIKLNGDKISYILYQSNDTNIYVMKYYLNKICNKILQSIKKIRNSYNYGFHKFLKSKLDTLEFEYFNIIIIPNIFDEYDLEYFADYMKDEYISSCNVPKNNLTKYLNYQLLILEKNINEFLRKIK